MKNTMKRVSALLLCAIMCILFCSCDMIDSLSQEISSLTKPKYGIVEDTSLGYTKIDKLEFSYSEHYNQYQCRDSYNLLENDLMRKLYDMMLENIYYVYPKADNGEYKTKQVILEESALSEAQVRLTIKALTDDNPEIFFLSSTFGFLIHDEYNYTAVQLYSRYSPQELTKKSEEFVSKVNGFYSSLEKGMSEYQRELYIHDYIINNCEYDTKAAQSADFNTKRSDIYESYGALVLNVAVCEGYSRAFQMLCHGVGIRCINLIGQSEGVLHMWSAVELDGDWYYVDATWDDIDDEAFRYDFFNITQKEIEKDREFSALASKMTDNEINGDSENNALTSNFFIPECNQKAYNYYVREAVHLTDYNSSKIVDSLLSSAMKKEKYFHFYIEPDKLDFDEAIDMLFYSQPQYFFEYINKANESLSEYAIECENLSVYKKDSLSVVTVVMKYI